MPTQYDTDQTTQQPASQVSQELAQQLHTFLLPLLVLLDRLLDVRLVRTLAQTVQVLIEVRNQAQGLLLSELGGYLLSPDKAPAATSCIVRTGRAISLSSSCGSRPISIWTAYTRRGKPACACGTKVCWKSPKA